MSFFLLLGGATKTGTGIIPAPAYDFTLTGPTLPSGAALTRTSVGSYTDSAGHIVIAAANQPRFDWGGALSVSPPTAVNDAYTTTQSTSLTISAPGVLSNDTDPNSLGLTVNSADTASTHGAISCNSDGSFIYTPVSGYTGTDTWTYNIKNTQGVVSSARATVTMTVNAPVVKTTTIAWNTPANGATVSGPVTLTFTGANMVNVEVTGPNGLLSSTSLTTNNLVTNCSTFNGTTWTNVGSPTFGTTKVAGPTGAIDAQPMTFTSARSGVNQVISPTLSPNTTYTGSLYVQGATAGMTIWIAYYNGNNAITQFSAAITPTTTWGRYSFQFTTGATDAAPSFVIINTQTDTGSGTAGTVNLAHAQVEVGSAVSPFVACAGFGGTSATISGNGTIATLTFDSTQLPDGATTFSATAYNVPAGQTATSTASAGTRTLTLKNNTTVTGAATIGSTYAQGYSTSRPAIAPAPKFLPVGGKGGSWTPVYNLTFGTAAKQGVVSDPTISDIPTLGNYVLGVNNCGGGCTATQYGQYGSVGMIPSSWNQLDVSVPTFDQFNNSTPRGGGCITGEPYSLGTNYLRVSMSATTSPTVSFGKVTTGRFSPPLIDNPLSSGFDVLVETQIRITGQPGQPLPFYWIAWWFTGQPYDFEIDTLETFAFTHSSPPSDVNDNSPCNLGHSDAVTSFNSTQTTSTTTSSGSWPTQDFHTDFVTMQMILYKNGNWICTWNGKTMSAGTYFNSDKIGLIVDNGWFGPGGNARTASGTEQSSLFPMFVDYTYLRYYFR